MPLKHLKDRLIYANSTVLRAFLLFMARVQVPCRKQYTKCFHRILVSVNFTLPVLKKAEAEKPMFSLIKDF